MIGHHLISPPNNCPVRRGGHLCTLQGGQREAKVAGLDEGMGLSSLSFMEYSGSTFRYKLMPLMLLVGVLWNGLLLMELCKGMSCFFYGTVS